MPHSARAIEAARLLQLSPKRLQDSFRAWTRAAAVDPAQATMFDKPATPEETWGVLLKSAGIGSPASGAESPDAASAFLAAGLERKGDRWKSPSGFALLWDHPLELWRVEDPHGQLTDHSAPDPRGAIEALRVAELKAGSATAAQTELLEAVPPAESAGFAATANQVAAGLVEPDRFGGRVYLSSLFDHWPDPQPEWEAWLEELLAAQERGEVELVGGELVGAMDPVKWEDSSIETDDGRTFRFFVPAAVEESPPPALEPTPGI
jgi:hypothetical protein